MNKRSVLAAAGLAALLTLPAAGPGQIIENPPAPAAKDAGRVLRLVEEWRITDDGGEFFFRYPGYFQIAGDGSVFITDKDQILRFSADGKFLKNVLRLGHGPGEMKPQPGGAMPEILVRGDDLYILDYGSLRCWRADLDGRLGKELAVPKSDWTILVGLVKDGLLFWRMDFPKAGSPGDGRLSIDPGRFFDLPETLTLAAWEVGKMKDIFTVTNRAFVSPRTTRPEHVNQALSTDGTRLYVVVGPEYLIQEVDLASGAVVKKFRRAYQRVPSPAPKRPQGRIAQVIEEDEKRGWRPPWPAYVDDITGLRVVGDLLWVSTSTRDADKGSLIDVFDRDGRYVDNFYTGKNWGSVQEGSVFRCETREDDTVVVIKSKIVK